jgi:hypothetical protein
MKKELYYVKSLEEDFFTKTLKGKNKVNFQSVYDIIKTKTLKPNTLSFGRKRRLSTTILNSNYLKTYRPQGIIFQTKETHDYIFPFDLTVLAATKDIIVHYYRIKNKLHIYYNHSLIPGFEKFIFYDFKKMIKRYPSLKKVWAAVNRFRKKAGFSELPIQKFRLIEYNEAIFHKPIKIKPIAIFGYRKETARIAEKLNLPHYVSAKHFYRSIQ